MILYIPHITPRHRYVFEHVFERDLGLKLNWFSDWTRFQSHCREFDEPAIIYADSDPRAADEQKGSRAPLFFKAAGLLDETGVKPQPIAVMQVDGLPLFFQVQGGTLSFDPFSAIFYLLSRYEEYLPYQADGHGRFPADASLAVRCGFLQIPVVDHYVQLIARVIQDKYPTCAMAPSEMKWVSTIDVDQAFAYKHKGRKRTWGAVIRDLFTFNWGGVFTRLGVESGWKQDPFDTFDLVAKMHRGLQLRPIVFFLMGSHGPFDKNIAPSHPAMKKVIQQVSSWADCGIHPSYGSHAKEGSVQAEAQRLGEITGLSVSRSRQHFLKIHLPETYRELVRAGISEDYSMGFADLPGFRASTSKPFLFYDLKDELSCPLVITPITYMDGTLKDYMGLSREQALDIIAELAREVQKVGGTFVSLWHNHSLSDYGSWKGWKSVFTQSWDSILDGHKKTS